MAEFVGYQQESMLPVYEEMKKRKLVTDTEIREIIKTRESYEYRLNRQTKSIKDFGEYIAYEKNLLATMTQRDKLNFPSNDSDRKYGPVENFIAIHIKSLFKQALHLFPEEPRLWDSYLKFCKHRNYYVEISNAYEKMLQYHGQNVSIWLRAIQWEFNETGNMEKVKDLLLRAIQRHPENEDLHLEFFKIMLSEAENMSTELLDNGISERDIGLKRVEVIYNSSRQKIHNVKYLVDILSILQSYHPLTKKLQKIVVDDMMESFPRDETVWDTFARRELEGFNICDLMENTDKIKRKQPPEQTPTNPDALDPTTEHMDTTENEEEVEVKPRVVKRTLKRRIDLCCGVYESAVKTLRTERMWTLYINTMLDLNRDMTTQQALKRKKLSEAFKGAFEAELLSRSHFESYVELLKESDTKKELIEEVMKKGTMVHPSSVTLWSLWMEYYAIENDPEKVYDIFRKATKKLASEAFPLWEMLLRYYQTRYDLYYKVDEIFKEAVKFTQPNFLKLRVQYLEWTLLNKNIEKTRQLYDELTTIFPPYYEMHSTMTLFESKQIKPDINRWRKCYENMIHFFGKERTDIWINYIKFERDNGVPKNMSVLYERAKATLHVHYINQFISEHSYLTTGIM